MKKTFGVWALLLVGLSVIVAISVLVDLGEMNLPVKSSGIAERLTKLPEKPATLPKMPVSNFIKKGIKNKVEADTAPQSILIIGDSMLEGLAPRLAAYANENGHTLNSVIWYSSTTEYWGASDTLRVYKARFKPTFIFISLGANELFVRDIAKRRDKFVKSLLRQIGDVPYLWIGPPNWKKDTGINQLIADNVPPGCFFLSDGMKFNRQKDGAHPTYESAALWVDSIVRWMPQHAAHPIRFDKMPTNKKARAKSTTVLQPLR